MEFKGLELDFDIFEADNADAYEAALENVKALAASKPQGESLGDSIRRQCNAVFDFFDDIFGDGFHKELFGEKTNLTECLQTYCDFTNLVSDQKAKLDTMLQEITGGNAAPAPNRAARRAAARAAQQ